MTGVVQRSSRPPEQGGPALGGGPYRPERANAHAGWLRRQGANAITASRLILTPPFLCVVSHAYQGGPAWVAGLLFAVIAATDVLDGRVARAMGSASGCGRVFDHATDLVFVLSSLLLFVGYGAVPWWVPAAVGASFTVYVADSWRRRGGVATLDLRGSRIGHAGGIVNYVLIGVVVGNDVCRLRLVAEPIMHALFLIVLLFSAASVLTRLLVWRGTDR